MRTHRLLLRAWYAMRERQHIRAASRCEEGRRLTLKRLAMADQPAPYQVQRYRKLMKIFWEA